MMKALDILCFTIFLISASVAIGLMMVWSDRGNRDQQLKLLVSCGIIFPGAGATMSVSKSLGTRVAS